MAKLYGEIAASALLTLDKSFARALGQPLDSTEIYYSKAAAEEYAAGLNAYVGQKIVVIEDNVVTHYSIEDTNGTLKELGSNVVVDNKSVEVLNDAIAIKDFGKAFYKYVAETEEEEAHYEKVSVSEENPWKAGLEPKVVSEDSQLVVGWFEPNPTTIEGVNDQVTAVQGSVKDIEDAIGTPGDENTEATGIYKEIDNVEEDVKELTDTIGTAEDSLSEETDTLWAHVNDLTDKVENIEIPVTGVSADDKVLSVANKVISATISMSYDEENKAIKLLGKDNVELGSVDATPFIKDGMLENVSYDELTNTLTFKWNTASGISEDTVVLSDIIEPYTAGNGLELNENTFAIKLADGSESFLTLTSEGLKLDGVQSAIDNAIASLASTYATIETVNGKADKATTLEGYGITDAYTKSKVDELINNINQGNQESAGAVSTRLETYITNNDSRVEILENKLETVEESAEKNIIEEIKVNNEALVVDENRSVNISVPTKFSDLKDDSGFYARITAAQGQADKGVQDASDALVAANLAQETANNNKSELTTLATTVTSHNDSIADHLSRISALEDADLAHNSLYSTLKTTVDGHTEVLPTLAKQTDLAGAITRIAANETAIAVLNETTIPALQKDYNDKLALKANTSDVYSKNEIGTIAEGKTIVQMIEEAKTSATYDDSEIRALLGTPSAEGAAATGLHLALENEINRATLVEQALAVKLENVGTVMDFVGVIHDEELPGAEGYQKGDVIIHKAQEYVFDGSDWQAFGDASINAALISALDTRVTANENAILAINDNNNGILAQAKNYTNEMINGLPAATADSLGMVKVDDETISVDEDGTIAVKAVSTDILVQGTEELVLYGGTSA